MFSPPPRQAVCSGSSEGCEGVSVGGGRSDRGESSLAVLFICLSVCVSMLSHFQKLKNIFVTEKHLALRQP